MNGTTSRSYTYDATDVNFEVCIEMFSINNGPSLTPPPPLLPSPAPPSSKPHLTIAALSLSSTALATLTASSTTSLSISASSTKTHLPLCPFSSSLSSSSSMSSSRPLRINSLLWSPSSLPTSMSPSIGAVTLLALGNGAPDVFASVAAVRGGHPRTGFGAILSAGTFVSALVVGFVAIYAAPFSVDPVPFVRDVLFYLTAALFLFYVYLSAEIFLWQAIGFVGF
ncbi:hypothetical protein HYC85_010253 [Camellia sinensis]|uniref:Sodium/calcium exchanger membrane region domain-containing protein n=1 Tax=Camellia sinensis TaxID=4442 RepID=A0A7J7HHX8_CAMSI|nr:hypothetical protein HYC85_010253 [Camellia sinensis]